MWVREFYQIITYMYAGDRHGDMNINSGSLIVTVDVFAVIGSLVCGCEEECVPDRLLC